jgi:hypothetical protein
VENLKQLNMNQALIITIAALLLSALLMWVYRIGKKQGISSLSEKLLKVRTQHKGHWTADNSQYFKGIIDQLPTVNLRTWYTHSHLTNEFKVAILYDSRNHACQNTGIIIQNAFAAGILSDDIICVSQSIIFPTLKGKALDNNISLEKMFNLREIFEELVKNGSVLNRHEKTVSHFTADIVGLRILLNASLASKLSEKTDQIMRVCSETDISVCTNLCALIERAHVYEGVITRMNPVLIEILLSFLEKGRDSIRRIDDITNLTPAIKVTSVIETLRFYTKEKVA